MLTKRSYRFDIELQFIGTVFRIYILHDIVLISLMQAIKQQLTPNKKKSSVICVCIYISFGCKFYNLLDYLGMPYSILAIFLFWWKERNRILWICTFFGSYIMCSAWSRFRCSAEGSIDCPETSASKQTWVQKRYILHAPCCIFRLFLFVFRFRCWKCLLYLRR